MFVLWKRMTMMGQCVMEEQSKWECHQQKNHVREPKSVKFSKHREWWRGCHNNIRFGALEKRASMQSSDSYCCTHVQSGCEVNSQSWVRSQHAFSIASDLWIFKLVPDSAPILHFSVWPSHLIFGRVLCSCSCNYALKVIKVNEVHKTTP